MDIQALLGNQQTLIAGAAALGIICFGLLLMPKSDGPSSNAKKRASALVSKAKGEERKGLFAGLKAEDNNSRRKQIEESLGNLEQENKDQQKKYKSLKSKLIQADMSTDAKTFNLISLGVGVTVALVAFIGGAGGLYSGDLPFIDLLIPAAFGLVIGFGLPRWIVGFKAKRRQAKFTLYFSDAMDIIVRGVRTGLPLGDCMKIIAHESQEPVRGEFRRLVEAEAVGVPIEICLERMHDRMPVSEVNFFSTVLNIQRSTGGNLGEALANLSNVLRGRKLLRGKIKALSAEAKASAMIIGALPIIVMVMVSIVSPEYMEPLYTTTRGHTNLMIGAGMMVMGTLTMRKMINFKF